VFFLCLGYGPANSPTQLSYARQQLMSNAARSADWRIVFFHAPIYSSGEHGGTMADDTVFISLCDSLKVNAVFNGHDHIYERSYLMYKRNVRSTSASITDTVGTIYTVIGVGGAPFYTVTGGMWTGFKMANTLAFCEITTTPNTMTIRTRGVDTAVIDQVTWTKPSTGTIAVRAPSIPQSAGMVARLDAGLLTIVNLPFAGAVTVELYSMVGRKVFSKPLTGVKSSATIPVADAARGAYAACVRKDKAWIWTPVLKM
jgi:hypothetical protein